MRHRHKLLLVLLVAWTFVAAFAPAAFAQVRCVESFPAANQSLPAAPDNVLLWMSEPVDPAFSTFAVVSQDGTTVSGPPRVSADGIRVELPVGDLEPGVYIVRYRATSLAKGHPATGFFLFGVAQPVLPPDRRADLGTVAPWASTLAGVVLAGLTLARWRTWRSIAGGQPDIERWLRLSALAAVLLALFNWGSHATATIGGSLSALAATGMVWPLLAGTPTGWSLLVLSGAAMILVIPATRRGRLLRALLSVWFTLAVAFTALSGGLLELSGSTHLAPMLLMLTAYGVASVVAAAVVSEMPGVRLPRLGWSDPVCAALIMAGVLLGL